MEAGDWLRSQGFESHARDVILPDLHRFIRDQGWGARLVSLIGGPFSVKGAGAHTAGACARALEYEHTDAPETDEIDDIVGLADATPDWATIRLEDRLFHAEDGRECEALYSLALRGRQTNPDATAALIEYGLEGLYGRVDMTPGFGTGRVLITNNGPLREALEADPPSGISIVETGDPWFDRAMRCYGERRDILRVLSPQVRALVRSTVESLGPVTLRTGPAWSNWAPIASSDGKADRLYFHVWYVNNPFRPIHGRWKPIETLTGIAERMAFPILLHRALT